MQLVPCTSLQVSSKTNLFYENDNLLLCPVTHMLALALSDSAFEASTMQDVDFAMSSISVVAISTFAANTAIIIVRGFSM